MATEPRFDQWIRAAMQSHEVPYQPDHWNVFESRLHADAQASEDDALREKLNSMEVPIQTTSWANFEDLLEDALPVDSIDNMIRAQLTGLEVPAAAASWQAMSARLDTAMPTEEAQFDENIRERVTRMEAAYNTNHWTIMAQKLDRQRRWYNLLLQYKVTEVALMMLLLFTVVNLTVISPAIKERNARVKYYIPDMNPNTKRISPYLPATALPSSPNNYIKSVPVTTKSAPINQPMASATLTPIVPTPTDGLLPLTPNEYGNSVIQDLTNLTTTTYDNTNTIQAPSVTEIQTTAVASLQKSIKLIDNPSKEVQPNIAFLATTIAEVKSIDLQDVAATQVSKFSVGLIASADIDNVKTPYDGIRRRKPYTIRGSGYTLGAMVNYNQKNTSVETGITYAEKAYSSPLTFKFGNFQDGYFEEKLKEIRYKIISVPVNFRFAVAHNSKHKLYLLGGATLHAVADAAYTRTLSVFTGGRDVESELPSYVPPSPSADMHFPEGFARGGTLAENVFVTANTGVGYEYNPKPGLSFYVQPTYQQNLSSQGLGPKHDKISSLSVLVGTRTSL